MKATASKTQNIQDISDALEALAQMHVMHDAMQDQISRLEADRTELRNKVEELEQEARDREDEIDALRSDIADLEDEINDAESKYDGDLEELQNHHAGDVPTLVKIRDLICRGDSKEARWQIEQLLHNLDSAWSCSGSRAGGAL